MADEFTELSAGGTIPIPARIRKELRLREGEVFRVRVVDGSIRLTRSAIVPAELYTEERIAEFLEAANMTDQELDAARQAWGLPVEDR